MNLEVNWGQLGRFRSGSLRKLQSNGDWGHLKSSSYTCLAFGLGNSQIAGGLKSVDSWGVFACGLSPCCVRVIVLLMPRLKAHCECTKRNWQKLPVFSALASAAMQHQLDCILFIKAVPQASSGAGVGDGHHLLIGGS